MPKISSTTSLTRQNAFLLEKNQVLIQLDPICQICQKHQLSRSLIVPCQCQTSAHKDCFVKWLKANGYPKYCSSCKSRYTIVLIPLCKYHKNNLNSVRALLTHLQ
ncbi:hypothetical protein BDF20DRAFT_673717 [Mycotypha africana]|uniref:uncharacterized protein n=1 Tax=Mycotypha africana TaxID=64632 RepID=UPI00230105A1|nr:uncharacterized protein BDF20DRAFT_673717 [Mycotypha africana]KAI8973808.1 hypothetical protein BDF20DRAFT_673717 [Mycotypha africana]